MKKEYIKPEIVVEEILLEGMLLAISGDTDIRGDGSGGGESEGGLEPWSNKRRGTWGNLWGEE